MTTHITEHFSEKEPQKKKYAHNIYKRSVARTAKATKKR